MHLVGLLWLLFSPVKMNPFPLFFVHVETGVEWWWAFQISAIVSKHSPLFSLASLYCWWGCRHDRRGARLSVRCLHHHQAAPHLMNGGRAAQPSPPTTMQPPVQWWPLVALLVLLACPCIIARNRFSKGPSIKYVSTFFFAIFDTPLQHVSTFLYLSVSTFPSIFDPSPLKKFWPILWTAPTVHGNLVSKPDIKYVSTDWRS